MSAAIPITRLDRTASELRGFARKCNDGTQVRRVLAIALVLDGRSRAEAAKQNGMDRQTLSDWVHRYNATGIEGLKSYHPPLLAHLGVEHIAAHSPQAPGRSERLFQTLQDRVPKELALAGVATMTEANAWLRDTYIPAHNARFAIEADRLREMGLTVSPGNVRRRHRSSARQSESGHMMCHLNRPT
jgi:hypothetical protein